MSVPTDGVASGNVPPRPLYPLFHLSAFATLQNPPFTAAELLAVMKFQSAASIRPATIVSIQARKLAECWVY